MITLERSPEITEARAHQLAMSLLTLAQGVPFFQGGDDLLRSKDMDNNSFDSGDWFNKIDFSFQTNNWGIGLPIARQNQSSWPIMQPLLANTALKESPQNIAYATKALQEYLAIRYSSRLFRMRTPNEIQANLSFLVELRLELHPVQQHSSDSSVRQSSFDSRQGTATIPALTTALFVSE